MICKHCQDRIPEDSRFCPKCGARLGTQNASNRPWFWIVVLLLVAVIWVTVVREELQIQLLNLRPWFTEP